VKPAVAGAADPPGAVPYRKGAGVFVPPGASTGPIVIGDGRPAEAKDAERGDTGKGDAETKIQVKAHPRKPPQAPTLEIVLEQFRLYELRPLPIGKFCVQWLQHQPELDADKQLPRSEALRRIREGLAKRDQVSLAARLDRFIACYWIATALGWDNACKLRYAAIRELAPLFGRNAANEEYVLRPERAERTKALWARMLSEHLTAEAVRAEVRKIRPPQVLRLYGRSGRLATIRRDLKRLKAREDFLEVIRIAQDYLERMGAAAGTAAG
jgi:hypothetical protein